MNEMHSVSHFSEQMQITELLLYIVLRMPPKIHNQTQIPSGNTVS